MKKLFFVVPLAIIGCASSPQKLGKQDQVLVMDTHVHAMSRNEVINAVTECEGSNLRASMVYAKRQINGKAVDIPVDVICAPRNVYFK